jgi:two-component system LytT family sensor kinase
MQLKVITSKLTGRVSRNIIFWLVTTYYLHGSSVVFYPYYPVLLVVVFISFGIPGYIHNLWLIPRFLLRRKYLQYTLLLVLLLLLTVAGSFYETHWVNDHVHGLNYMGASKDVAMMYHLFPTMLMLSFLAFGKFMGDSIRNQKKLEDLQKEKLQSELESLRSQINPHFLFNALNTIYGMARRTDHATADAIIKLSDILRHGLYECEDQQISLDKEIVFLKQFVEFAQLRLHDKEKIQLAIDAEVNDQHIAPLLLIPFIENAIKHGLQSNEDSWVKVDLSVLQNSLTFSCRNSCNNLRTGGAVAVSSGIGLKNVRRRLELLYPGNYLLDIKHEPHQFAVTLKLQLS